MFVVLGALLAALLIWVVDVVLACVYNIGGGCDL
jgi:hypothetical protein